MLTQFTGCMPVSTSQIHASPNVFSLFPEVWKTQLQGSCQGNSSSWGLFLYLTTGPDQGQHSKHERAFSFVVILGLGPPHHTVLGASLTWCSRSCLGGCHSHPRRGAWHSLESCYPEATHRTPSNPTHLIPSPPIPRSHLSQLLSLQHFTPQSAES